MHVLTVSPPAVALLNYQRSWNSFPFLGFFADFLYLYQTLIIPWRKIEANASQNRPQSRCPLNCRTGPLTGLCSMFCRESPPSPLLRSPEYFRHTYHGWLDSMQRKFRSKKTIQTFLSGLSHILWVPVKGSPAAYKCWQLPIFLVTQSPRAVINY
jgi:hypothetical protein